MRRALTGPVGLWAAVALVHAWLSWLALALPGWPLGDVQFTYAFWVDQALHGQVVGLDTAWVYPPLALVPILLPAIAGMAAYPVAWLVMIAVLDAVTIGVLTGWGRRRERLPIAWWWLAFLVLLGPIAVARLDAVTVAMGVVAAATILSRPAVAGVLLAAAAWIKVWPAGILAAAVVALRSRLVLAFAGVGTTVGVLALGALAGGTLSLLSSVTEQTDRGLQIEAVVATPWMWAVAAGAPGVHVYYDRDILTYQLEAPGAEAAAAATTPALVVVALAILGLALLAVRRGAAPERVLAPAALAVTTALVVANKVGSPQFTAWLAVPVVLALVVLGRVAWREWLVPIVLATASAALTQAIYPVLYDDLLGGAPLLVGILTLRNAITVALLAWGVVALVRLVRTPVPEGSAP